MSDGVSDRAVRGGPVREGGREALRMGRIKWKGQWVRT